LIYHCYGHHVYMYWYIIAMVTMFTCIDISLLWLPCFLLRM